MFKSLDTILDGIYDIKCVCCMFYFHSLHIENSYCYLNCYIIISNRNIEELKQIMIAIMSFHLQTNL